MARTTQEILTTMDEEQAAQTELSALNSPSQTSIYKLWKYIVAQCQNLLEQLMDAKKIELENVLAQGRAPSLYWVISKAYEFQYDATTPQLIYLDSNLVPKYVTVDATKRIITRATALPNTGICYLYLAKNDPPVKLTSLELAAIQGYYSNTGNGTVKGIGIAAAGQSIACVSLDPDLLFMEATIYFYGQYAGNFKNDCLLVINNYISNLGINPVIRTQDLVDKIQSVVGFSDISIVNLAFRDAATLFANKLYLINASTTIYPAVSISAGYMIGETTVGQTFLDKITFTSV